MIIDEGEDWVGNKDDEDDELKPMEIAVEHPLVATTQKNTIPIPPPPSKRMADGTGAGCRLQRKSDVILRNDEKVKRAALAAMEPHQSGRDAPTVYRDKLGRKVDKEDEYRADEAKREQLERDKEEQVKFREGLAQKRLEEERRRRLEEEKTANFAVYVDDRERNEEMMERDRWGDPMARLGGGEKKKKTGRKRYVGPPAPPNRYGIEPGHRWDGVDRGNGFETKLIQAKYARQNRAEEAHKWSTEDLNTRMRDRACLQSDKAFSFDFLLKKISTPKEWDLYRE
ncbi:Pre-mRNA-splicing factor of RES complex-domain-containing protein [Chytridium lagenaria]|nr:Pre-mRNA-splicing factor of RES complex-domain-containing protein [Chytridium lagenaria]